MRNQGRNSINMDTILAFSFGTFFSIVLLSLAVLVPNPTESTMFIFRVILSVAAAGVGAVIPGMLNIQLPYVRAGGAIALAIIVYFFNPPALISTSLDQRISQLINASKSLINRGNFERGLERIRQAQAKSQGVDYPEISFYLGVIEKRNLRYKSAEEFFHDSLRIIETGAKPVTDIGKADILYEIAMMQDGQKKFLEAFQTFKRAREVVVKGTFLEADIVFELGRTALAIWLNGKTTDDQKYLLDSEQYFGLFNERDWPNLFSKIWGNYHMSCVYSELVKLQTRTGEAAEYRAKAKLYIDKFTQEADSLLGQRKFEFQVVVYMAFNGSQEYLPGAPLACSVPFDMSRYFVNYRATYIDLKYEFRTFLYATHYKQAQIGFA